jgi:ribosome biogenesis protein ERB1
MLSATLKRKRPGDVKRSEETGTDDKVLSHVNGDVDTPGNGTDDDYVLSEDETDEGPFPEFDPASDSEITDTDSDYDKDTSFDIKLFPEADVVISNITGQPKRTYPEIDPVYDSDSSTEEVCDFFQCFYSTDS